MKKQKYILLNKAVFFQEQSILAFGDLHLGYESMLKSRGLTFPVSQLEQSKKDLKKIIKELKKNSSKNTVKKIILLGDLKHHFNFHAEEKFEVREFLKFIEEELNIKKIILIKGNHEKFELDKRKYFNYYIEPDSGIAFVHGHKMFPEIFDSKQKIKTIVMSHLHPAVFLSDKSGKIKREKYKCFFIGKWKRKKIIIVPSFFPLIEGTDIETESHYGKHKYGNFSIIPKEQLKKFKVFIPDEEKNKVYEFGRLKDLS